MAPSFELRRESTFDSRVAGSGDIGTLRVFALRPTYGCFSPRNRLTCVRATMVYLRSSRAGDLDPFTGDLFAFVGKRGDRVKILVWHRGGFLLMYKRLEKGRFRIPQLDRGQRKPYLIPAAGHVARRNEHDSRPTSCALGASDEPAVDRALIGRVGPLSTVYCSLQSDRRYRFSIARALRQKKGRGRPIRGAHRETGSGASPRP